MCDHLIFVGDLDDPYDSWPSGDLLVAHADYHVHLWLFGAAR